MTAVECNRNKQQPKNMSEQNDQTKTEGVAGIGSKEVLYGHHETVETLIAAWDKGETIWSLELGGLGPGYEQAIQVCAVELARGCKDMTGMKNDDKESTTRFRAKCDEIIHAIDDKLGGLSGAMVGAAEWLAWQWCFNGGPAALQKRLKERGESDRAIQVSTAWPKAV